MEITPGTGWMGEDSELAAEKETEKLISENFILKVGSPAI